MEQVRSTSITSAFIIFNALASALAGGYGFSGGYGGGYGGGYSGGGGGGGFGGGFGGGGGGGYGGGFSSASSSASAGAFGTVASTPSSHNVGHLEANPFLNGHQNTDTGVSVTVHKDLNLNGVKEGVDSLLGGILSSVAQIGGTFVGSGGGYVCKNGKCSGNDFELGSEGLRPAQGGLIIGKPEVAIITDQQNCNGAACNTAQHQPHHNKGPKISNGPQITEGTACTGPSCQKGVQSGHVNTGVSVGSTFGINSGGSYSGPPNYGCSDGSCRASGHPANKPLLSAGPVPSLNINKEISFSFGNNGNSNGNKEKNSGSYACNQGKCGGKDFELGSEDLFGVGASVFAGAGSQVGSHVSLGPFNKNPSHGSAVSLGGSGGKPNDCTNGNCGVPDSNSNAFNGVGSVNKNLGQGSIIKGLEKGHDRCTSANCGAIASNENLFPAAHSQIGSHVNTAINNQDIGHGNFMLVLGGKRNVPTGCNKGNCESSSSNQESGANVFIGSPSHVGSQVNSASGNYGPVHRNPNVNSQNPGCNSGACDHNNSYQSSYEYSYGGSSAYSGAYAYSSSSAGSKGGSYGG